MRSYKLGFDKDQIAMVTLGMETVKKSGDLLVNRLKEYAGIEDVGFASTLVGASDVYSSNYFSYNNNGFGSEIIDVMELPGCDGHSCHQWTQLQPFGCTK